MTELPKSEFGQLKHRVKELERRSYRLTDAIVMLKQRQRGYEETLRSVRDDLNLLLADVAYGRREAEEEEELEAPLEREEGEDG